MALLGNVIPCTLQDRTKAMHSVLYEMSLLRIIEMQLATFHKTHSAHKAMGWRTGEYNSGQSAVISVNLHAFKTSLLGARGVQNHTHHVGRVYRRVGRPPLNLGRGVGGGFARLSLSYGYSYGCLCSANTIRCHDKASRSRIQTSAN